MGSCEHDGLSPFPVAAFAYDIKRRVSILRDAAPFGDSRHSRVAANGRPLGRAGDLAVVRERFAEHPSGLFAGGPRYGAHNERRSG